MLKNIILCIAGIFFTNSCLAQAQETTRKSRWLTDSVYEAYTVLKTDKNIKHGPYRALFLKKKPVAEGDYANNIKTGLWHFYNEKGEQLQTYNYTTKAFEFLAPADTTTYLHYVVDKKITPADKVTLPVKLGGTYYGYIPYLRLFDVPNKMYAMIQANKDYIEVLVELLVSPGGRLADYKISLNIDRRLLKAFNMNPNLPDPADVIFTPATVNGEPVTSRILIKAYITDDNHLDYE
ncbi:hypothetical protein IDJ77_21780 [Mucilaginibacter sp. ZT4R22]|uniref:Outer membrane lipoprotein-sorting protein n=1 Tax=Mucilaginibacter pankratovii TaxID=2772110 RepID=A0ABR7WW09_9SPHI|nr:hypothetical protein [Mucilaginibacter pankratovii]MBD1366459.1 hypothetical protein [Mucilaginibacter pankratovii]